MLLEATGILAALYLFFLLAIPICLYAAQKWAYKNYCETQKLNGNIEKLIAILQKP